MNNEKRFTPNQSNESSSGLLYEDLTFIIRGCIFKVYNTLGPGHKEIIYQNALESELAKNNLKYESQKVLRVYYNDEKMGVYKPDLVIEDKIVIEIKAAEFNIKRFEMQVLSYLTGNKYKLGLLVNFGREEVYIKRLIDSHK